MIIIVLATFIVSGCKDFDDDEMKIYNGKVKK